MANLITLVSFDGTDGGLPESGLLIDGNGNLIGTTDGGGTDSDGTVFEVINNGGGSYNPTPNTLVTFSGSGNTDNLNPGENPGDGLIANGNGDLFGTTESGGPSGGAGTVFELVPNSTGYSQNVLVSFNSFTGGTDPRGGLVADSAGDLFGTTQFGNGADSNGTVFELVNNGTAANPSYASMPTTLVAFSGTSGTNLGSDPTAGLTLVGGNLFGTTFSGGDGDGTVFELANNGAGGYTFRTLVNFTGIGGTDPGETPQGGLIADTAGDLFGTTAEGGTSGNDGTVFELKNNGDGSYTFSTLASFDDTDGKDPVADLLIDADGNLFGTTDEGGSDPNDGTVFELADNGGTYGNTPMVLVSFNGANGSNPTGSLIADAEGNLYGTTSGGDGSGTVFEVTDSGFVPCFCAGTFVLTERGEAPVETLSVGDMVVTLSSEAKPIVWIGFGRTLVTPRNRCDVAPVIVRRHALAENVPHRDLHVTRRHAILVEDVLVPVEHLINGVSVMWDNAAGVVEYYHIELDDHDVLLADGAPAESFRDDDSRHLFQNELCRPPGSGWAPPCKPVVTHGPLLEAAWRAVAARVGKLPEERLTEDPGLHLLVDGRRVEPSFAAGEIVRVRLDRAPSSEIAIISRSCIPHAHELNGDLRRLGVGVTGLTIFYEGGRRAVPLSATELGAGFHEFEGDIRWTKGRGALPASLFADIGGAVDIELRLAGTLPYPRDLEGSFGERRSPAANAIPVAA